MNQTAFMLGFLKQAALKVAPSKIHGEGLFTTEELPSRTNVGLGMTPVSRTGNLNRDYQQSPHAKKVNHSSTPNMTLKSEGGKLLMVTIQPVTAGDELTVDYGKITNQVASDFLKKTAKYDGRGHPKYKVFKKNKVDLTPEERALVMKRKAVWHFSPKNVATPAVSKAVINGKTWFETHTHRAINYASTVRGAISRYHKFIKGTA